MPLCWLHTYLELLHPLLGLTPGSLCSVHSSPALLNARPLAFKARHSAGSFLGVGFPAHVGLRQTPCPFGGSSAILIVTEFVGCPPEYVGFDYVTSLPLLLVLLWVLLSIFNCSRSFPLVFRSFSSTVAV